MPGVTNAGIANLPRARQVFREPLWCGLPTCILGGKKQAGSPHHNTIPENLSSSSPDWLFTKEPKAKSTAARADVKKEAAAAEKAGTIPAGEAGSKDPMAKSTKARAEVKAETKDAVKKGEIAKGEGTK